VRDQFAAVCQLPDEDAMVLEELIDWVRENPLQE
jgi:hypothetical protein